MLNIDNFWYNSKNIFENHCTKKIDTKGVIIIVSFLGSLFSATSLFYLEYLLGKLFFNLLKYNNYNYSIEISIDNMGKHGDEKKLFYNGFQELLDTHLPSPYLELYSFFQV